MLGDSARIGEVLPDDGVGIGRSTSLKVASISSKHSESKAGKYSSESFSMNFCVEANYMPADICFSLRQQVFEKWPDRMRAFSDVKKISQSQNETERI